MRTFQTLNHVSIDEASGVMLLSVLEDREHNPMVTMRREGVYIAINAAYGPLEIALRPRTEEMTRLLGRLQPVDGLQTTRQIGTVGAYLAVGLGRDGSLVMRPTIVADATGHLSFNLMLTPDVRQTFFAWLGAGE
jgi:hypothetical protein